MPPSRNPHRSTPTSSRTGTILALCLVLLGAYSSSAAFVAVPQSLVSDASLLRLARAESLYIPYSAIAYNSSVADLPAFRLSLDAQFAALTQAQFDGLLAQYSFGVSKSRVFYNASASYRFTDFLPPLLQALSTLHFHTQYCNFSLPDVLTGQQTPAVCQRTQLSINCWGFAYDALLSAQELKLFFTLSVAHSQVAWGVLTDPALSLPLRYSNSTPDFFSNASARNSGLQPGDFFLIFHDSPAGVFLDHVAIFLDDDVFFERAGAGNNVPFRVTDWSSIVAVWQPGVFQYAVRRSGNNSTGERVQRLLPQGPAFGLHNGITLQQLPELRQWVNDSLANVFAASPEFADDKHGIVNGNAYVWIADTEDLLFDAAGRANLPESSFDEKNLLPLHASAC